MKFYSFKLIPKNSAYKETDYKIIDTQGLCDTEIGTDRVIKQLIINFNIFELNLIVFKVFSINIVRCSSFVFKT